MFLSTRYDVVNISLDVQNKVFICSLINFYPSESHLFFFITFCLEGRKEMFYLMTHSTHFIYGYMALDIWLRTILIVRKETRCHHIGYSFRLAAMVLLYALSHRQDSAYHSLCYTSHGALAGTRNSSFCLMLITFVRNMETTLLL